MENVGGHNFLISWYSPENIMCTQKSLTHFNSYIDIDIYNCYSNYVWTMLNPELPGAKKVSDSKKKHRGYDSSLHPNSQAGQASLILLMSGMPPDPCPWHRTRDFH